MIDLPTALQACAVLTGGIGLLVLLGRPLLGTEESKSLWAWVMGCAGISLGQALLAQRSDGSLVVTLILAHTVIAAGLASFRHALRRHCRARLARRWGMAAVLAMAAVTTLTTVVWEAPEVRLWAVLGLYALLLGGPLVLTLRDWAHASLPIRLLGGVFGLALATLFVDGYLVRANPVASLALGGSGLGIEVLIAASGLLPAFGTVLFLLAMMELSATELRATARIDFLTGAYNRRSLEETAEWLIRNLRRERSALAVLMIDLDHFKALNDRHGHAAGDQALVEFTQRVKRSLRAQDVLGRVGGEEFVVLLPKADATIARLTAERLCHAIASQPFAIAGASVRLTASMGIALLEPNDGSIAEAIARADRALYSAKRQGRNRVVNHTAASSSGEVVEAQRLA